MRRCTLRHDLHAITLLLVMLLQVGMKTLHVHHEHASVKVECDDCNQHRLHDGHFIDWDGQNDDCLLCQLLSCQYTASEGICPDAIAELFCPLPQGHQPAAHPGQWQSTGQRGPPSYLL